MNAIRQRLCVIAASLIAVSPIAEAQTAEGGIEVSVVSADTRRYIAGVRVTATAALLLRVLCRSQRQTAS